MSAPSIFPSGCFVDCSSERKISTPDEKSSHCNQVSGAGSEFLIIRCTPQAATNRQPWNKQSFPGGVAGRRSGPTPLEMITYRSMTAGPGMLISLHHAIQIRSRVNEELISTSLTRCGESASASLYVRLTFFLLTVDKMSFSGS